jgi:hypothetical protein
LCEEAESREGEYDDRERVRVAVLAPTHSS